MEWAGEKEAGSLPGRKPWVVGRAQLLWLCRCPQPHLDSTPVPLLGV